MLTICQPWRLSTIALLDDIIYINMLQFENCQVNLDHVCVDCHVDNKYPVSELYVVKRLIDRDNSDLTLPI